MIIPRPRSMVRTGPGFTLDPATAVHADPGAQGVAETLRELLAPATGLPLPPAPHGEVRLALDPALPGAGEEGYRLEIAPGGVTLAAARRAGLLHGVQTLRQLLPPQVLGPAPERDTEWHLPGVRISDAPRHRWRGAMLDVARRFLPAPFLHRFVDLLALHKLNVLHLHLTDDQGWRMPVTAYPRLVEVGGWRERTMTGPAGSSSYDDIPHGGAYTAAELRALVRHAASRGVTVVPEIEMPGHTRAALAAYPHLGNQPERTLRVWTDWGVCENVLGVHEEVLDFCATVLHEVMDVFPSRYIHLGGDECPITEWQHSPAARRRCAAENLAGPAQLRAWFLGRMGDELASRGRRPLCWAEEDATLPEEFTVMPWRDAEHGLAAARRGHDLVMAPHRSTYLDYPQSDSTGEPPGQPGAVVDLRTVHATDPAPAHWPAAAADRVLGTQAQLWTEFVTGPRHAEYLAFPRLCALADRAWNPHSDFDAHFLPALRTHRLRLAALGVPSRPPSAAPAPRAAAAPR